MRSKPSSKENGVKSNHQFKESTKIFRAASHPYRLSILETVSEETKTFTEIAHDLGIDAATEPGLINFHIRKLLDSDLVERKGHAYELTDLGGYILSFARGLKEKKLEEEMVGMKIEETTTNHVPAIREFFKKEYGASEEWLGNIDRTYPMLISGNKMESEESQILSLVALSGERVVGFICGRITEVDVPRVSMSDLEVDEKSRRDFLKYLEDSKLDLARIPEMSQEERTKLQEKILSRIWEIKGIGPEELDKEAKKWKDQDSEAWIDVLWSIEHNGRFVKKRLVSEFIEKAKEQKALLVQAFLRNPEDTEIVQDLGFGKLDGEFHASFIGPQELFQRKGVIYQVRLGKSMAVWEFAEDSTRSRTKITDVFGDLAISLDFSGLDRTGI